MQKSLEKLIKDGFEPWAKKRKAKNTLFCIYKKENDLFWYVSNTRRDEEHRLSIIAIKPWCYDELLDSIVHPQSKPIHFTDKMRWECFSAMTSYIISERYYDYPNDIIINRDKPNLELIAEWCQIMFEDSMAVLDGFIENVSQNYGDLNQYFIINYARNPCMAVFAYLKHKDYDNAKEILNYMKANELIFNRVYGSYTRDLRDILLDYCIAKQNHDQWTNDNVVGQI